MPPFSASAVFVRNTGSNSADKRVYCRLRPRRLALLLVAPAVLPVAPVLDEQLVDERAGLDTVKGTHPTTEHFHTQVVDVGFVRIVVTDDGVDEVKLSLRDWSVTLLWCLTLLVTIPILIAVAPAVHSIGCCIGHKPNFF